MLSGRFFCLQTHPGIGRGYVYKIPLYTLHLLFFDFASFHFLERICCFLRGKLAASHRQLKEKVFYGYAFALPQRSHDFHWFGFYSDDERGGFEAPR
jgi:hypothetical protein